MIRAVALRDEAMVLSGLAWDFVDGGVVATPPFNKVDIPLAARWCVQFTKRPEGTE